jgi:hypothetical protein
MSNNNKRKATDLRVEIRNNLKTFRKIPQKIIVISSSSTWLVLK